MFEPSVDERLTPLLAVSGLDNYKKPLPASASPDPSVAARRLGRQRRRGSGSAGYLGTDFLGNAYAPGVSLDGTGQSVGLFELSGYDINDITAYEDEAGCMLNSLVRHS